MNRIESCAKIEAIPTHEIRPTWSVLIPTYNCATYLEETLQSVLSQGITSERMEIIVIDDHSTLDNPEEVVERIGKGRVLFVQQKQNVGKVRNYETGLKLSKGKLIHQLHGDDRILPGFYEEMELLFQKFPEADAAFCRTIYIDERGRWKRITGMIKENDGIIENLDRILYVNQVIQTPSMVVKREVYENIGGFDRRFNCMEDWEMWFRISRHYKVATSNKVLAEYRTHPNNATYLTTIDGSSKKTYKLLKQLMDSELSNTITKELVKARKQRETQSIIESALNSSSKDRFRNKLKTIYSINRLNVTVKTIFYSFKILFKK